MECRRHAGKTDFGKMASDVIAAGYHVSKPSEYHKYLDRADAAAMLRSAGRFGTPQYFLDRKQLAERAYFFRDTFRKHIPSATFFYAFKCNDFPGLLLTLKESGYNADVASLFEMRLAEKLGFRNIIFTSPGKSDDELELAIKLDAIINVDSADELQALSRIAGRVSRTPRISFRVNTGNAGAWSKFGLTLGELDECVKALPENVEWAGLHFHCSWNRDPGKYVENIGILGRHLKSLGYPPLRFIDIGGGFFPEGAGHISGGEKAGMIYEILGCGPKGYDPYAFSIDEVKPLEAFARAIRESLDTHILSHYKDMEIYLEPGRFIATHSTTILVKVISVKESCVIVDGGRNLVSTGQFAKYGFVPILNLTRPDRKLKRRNICGPLCSPADVWGYSYYGDGIQKGDIMAILHQGAYTFSCARRFIKPVAQYVISDNGRLSLGMGAERFEDRYRSSSHTCTSK